MDNKISELFAAEDSDITLQSSDGVKFKVHRLNLRMHSEGFAGADDISPLSPNDKEPEVVVLSEKSAVLSLLLQYMYRRPQPDLRNISFALLSGLAEAAEKYEVYSATMMCNMLMEKAIPHHPHEVLLYSFKHNYLEMMDEAAPLTIGDPNRFMKCAVATNAMRVLASWMKYLQHWTAVLNRAHKCKRANVNHLYNSGNKCPHGGIWSEACVKVQEQIAADPSSLTRLQAVFAVGKAHVAACSFCLPAMEQWETEVEKYVNSIPKLSTLT